MKPYNFKLDRSRLGVLSRAIQNWPEWRQVYFDITEEAQSCLLLAFWSCRCKSIRPASEVSIWETMRDECDRRISQADAKALSRMIPVGAEEERKHYDRLATRIRTEGGRKCKSILAVIQKGITNWRPEDRPLLERTLEIAMNCDWHDLAIEDLFCAVVGDERYRRLLAGIFRVGRGTVAKDPELARFWDREAEMNAELVGDRNRLVCEHAPLPPEPLLR